MKKQIFIGGTGRSGTSILYKLLGSHKNIYAFENEMRFITDYNGLINLVDALTINYSVIQAREALYQFEKFMKIHLTTPQKPPYFGIDFNHFFGKEFFEIKTEEFIRSLVDFAFYGTDYQVEPSCLYHVFTPVLRNWTQVSRKFQRIQEKLSGRKRRRKNSFWPKRRLKNAKYFSDRNELCRLTGQFVDDLFSEAARRENKTAWCEKTPANLLHLDFLWEILPDAYFIHIKRDPRGVANSMTNQFWASPNLEDICTQLSQHFHRWFDLKEQLEFSNKKYLEIKLEDLAQDKENNIQLICDFLGVENAFVNMPQLELSRVDYWKDIMPSYDIELVNKKLGWWIEEMGY